MLLSRTRIQRQFLVGMQQQKFSPSTPRIPRGAALPEVFSRTGFLFYRGNVAPKLACKPAFIPTVHLLAL